MAEATDALHRIVYVSRASRWIGELDVLALAAHANVWNTANGVTGLLLYDRARFLQAIEGSPSAVASLMARITHDDRHGDIQVHKDIPADHRLFGNWGMRFRHLGEQPTDVRFLNEVKAFVASVDDPVTMSLFIGFAALSRRG